MVVLTEGGLQFTFPTKNASKYDDWAFYRNQFQKVANGTKAIDFIFVQDSTTWLIEVKDYRVHRRSKEISIEEEIALKVKDTVAGLLAAKMNANNTEEKQFATKVINSTELKFVLHLEQPPTNSRLFPQAFNLANVKLAVKNRIKAIDAHPKVVDLKRMNALPWQVR